MVFRIVIAGRSQSTSFAHSCIIADYLSQQLPNFCYERIEKSVKDWNMWLSKINQKNNWHHFGSPIIWKELLLKGSKPYYIGGKSEFLEYCQSYYKFDTFLSTEKIEDAVKNFSQLKNKSKVLGTKEVVTVEKKEEKPNTGLIVSISGVRFPLAMLLIYGLINISDSHKNVSKIYIYDDHCTSQFMESVERECEYIVMNFPGKIIKCVKKLGYALTNSDIYIVLDHVPFSPNSSIGEWLYCNNILMMKIAEIINASAPQKMKVIFANLGPACYNATLLRKYTNNAHKHNIVVATSDLGLEILKIVAEQAQIPVRNIFCPPVWGFVGINHLIDIKTTIHRYNYFEPYERHTKVVNSSLKIGCLTPEFRTLEYLFHFSDKTWKILAAGTEKTLPRKQSSLQLPMNKAMAVLDVIKLWLLSDSENIINLGIFCDGSFGLNFQGILSQPAKLQKGKWIPAAEFTLPKDKYIKLPYLVDMAETIMKLEKSALPPVVPYCPCTCVVKIKRRNEVW